jgi:uridine phosphorylase
MRWYSRERPIISPKLFAPEDLDFVRLSIIVFIKRVYDWMKSATSNIFLEKEDKLIGAKRFFATRDGLAVFHSYFGAPAAVMLAEALISGGIRNLLVLGEAGAINSVIDVGEIVVPTFAIREEGTSYHYFPPEIAVRPSKKLLIRVKRLLDNFGFHYIEGGVWSTDAPFRETREKVLRYSSQGVHAVEMECSALFSIAQYRRAKTAALLVITDTLYGKKWKQAFEEPRVIDNERRISEILVKHWSKIAQK